MRAFKPKGLTLYKNIRTGRYGYFMKSRGRTGAAIRSWFARQHPDIQQYILSDWWNKRAYNSDY